MPIPAPPPPPPPIEDHPDYQSEPYKAWLARKNRIEQQTKALCNGKGEKRKRRSPSPMIRTVHGAKTSRENRFKSRKAKQDAFMALAPEVQVEVAALQREGYSRFKPAR